MSNRTTGLSSGGTGPRRGRPSDHRHRRPRARVVPRRVPLPAAIARRRPVRGLPPSRSRSSGATHRPLGDSAMLAAESPRAPGGDRRTTPGPGQRACCPACCTSAWTSSASTSPCSTRPTACPNARSPTTSCDEGSAEVSTTSTPMPSGPTPTGWRRPGSFRCTRPKKPSRSWSIAEPSASKWSAFPKACCARSPSPPAGVPTLWPGQSHWWDTFGLDSAFDYDPVWARARQLGFAVTFHGALATRPGVVTSPTNFVFNHLGMFADLMRPVCKSLMLGGVTRRFPDVAFAFLECGVSWAHQLLLDIVGHWEKRNVEALSRAGSLPRRLRRHRGTWSVATAVRCSTDGRAKSERRHDYAHEAIDAGRPGRHRRLRPARCDLGVGAGPPFRRQLLLRL